MNVLIVVLHYTMQEHGLETENVLIAVCSHLSFDFH